MRARVRARAMVRVSVQACLSSHLAADQDVLEQRAVWVWVWVWGWGWVWVGAWSRA